MVPAETGAAGAAGAGAAPPSAGGITRFTRERVPVIIKTTLSFI